MHKFIPIYYILHEHAQEWQAQIIPESSPNLCETNVPTFDELGLKGFESVSWTSMFAPKQTPPEIIERISVAIKAVLADSIEPVCCSRTKAAQCSLTNIFVTR